MKLPISKKIKELAKALSPEKIYFVGGFVRNFLIDGSANTDFDMAAAISIDKVKEKAEQCGFKICGVYPRTQTLVFSDGCDKYEYTAFREENYAEGGGHTPFVVKFISDIEADAKRRDFKCNAVYYDVLEEKTVDPLGGEKDIKNRVINTVKDPEKVFSHDGLRLMRLARFCGELGFSPTEEVKESARLYAKNIKDISAERIYSELKLILRSDGKYGFSPKDGHYYGLKILEETGVLDYIIPELTLGRGMKQRQDFHDYDVLEHSLRCVLYAPEKIRLAALLHDVGKPFAMKKEGRYKNHAEYGSEIVKNVLLRLKAEKKVIKQTVFLTKFHMLDMKGDMRENKLKIFIAENFKDIYDLLALKQADYSACKDDLSVCSTVRKWLDVIENMKKNGVPFSLKELRISAKTLMANGIFGEEVGKTLEKLQKKCILEPKLNEEHKLLKIALQENTKTSSLTKGAE